jgi:hypothetical protein
VDRVIQSVPAPPNTRHRAPEERTSGGLLARVVIGRSDVMGAADESATTLRKPVVAAAAFDISQSFDMGKRKGKQMYLLICWRTR